jgi:hypothetical protein
MTRMRASMAVLLSLAGWLVLPGVADAQIVKCRDAQGRLTYTAETCPAGTTPEALPKDISPDLPEAGRPVPGSASTAAPPLPPTSAATSVPSAEFRAREKYFRECIGAVEGHSVRCDQFFALRLKCVESVHWETPDCRALAEYYTLLERESEQRRVASARELCRQDPRANGPACERAECGFKPATESDTARIISCARRRHLKVANTWVQFEKSAPGREHSLGIYVCQQVWRLRSGAGQWGYQRAFFTIDREIVAGRPTAKLIASGLPDMRFDSVDEAAFAGCAETNRYYGQSAWRPENRIPGQTPPKIPVGYILPAQPFTPEQFAARKVELESQARACAKADATGCEPYRRRLSTCKALRNRLQLDCQAFVEVLPKVSAETRAASHQTFVDLCAKHGARGYCQAVYCSNQHRFEKSDELVRQCPTRYHWRSSPAWWQVNEFMNGPTWTASFMCVQSWPLKGRYGEPMDLRGYLLALSPANQKIPTGPFTTTSIEELKDRSFARVEDLADEGCRVLNERYAALQAKSEEAAGALEAADER